jgi:hypothetical protein
MGNQSGTLGAAAAHNRSSARSTLLPISPRIQSS